jgi:anti-sigma B factor antagonist
VIQWLDMGDLREPPVRNVERRDGAAVIVLGGELDLYNADDIRSALAGVIGDAPRCVVVDMADVEFIDSTALGVLIEARSHLGENRLRLAAPQLGTKRTLEVTGLDRQLPVYDSVEAAL